MHFTDRKIAVTLALSAGLVWIPIALSAGLFADDLILSAWVARTSWGSIFTGEAGPFILYMAYWKALLPLNPENPHITAHVIAALLHGAHCGLLFMLFRPLMQRRPALFWAIAASLYRAGSEALLWAAAINDVLLGLLTTCTVLLWSKGGSTRRFRWVAIAPYAIALYSKPSAAGIVGICLAWSLFLEDNQSLRRRVSGILPPLAVMSGLGFVCALNAYFRPGYWAAIYPRVIPNGDFFSRMGEALFRGFVFFSPSTLHEVPVTGYLSLAAVLALFLLPSPAVRTGLLWAISIQAIPVFVSDAAGSRYGYPATGGYLLAASGMVALALPDTATRLHMKAVRSGIALWLLVSVLFLAWDIRCRITWGRLYAETRQLLHQRKSDIIGAQAITAVRLPRILPYWQLIEYDFKMVPPRKLSAPECPKDGSPCLVFRRDFPTSISTSYIRRDEWPFVVWGE